MKELYKYLNNEIEYFFNEQEFMERDFLLVDVTDYLHLNIDEDEIDEKKLLFSSKITSVEIEDEKMKIEFDRFYLQDLREELMNDWNNQEIVKRRNWIDR